jgi:hypothetical protein
VQSWESSRPSSGLRLCKFNLRSWEHAKYFPSSGKRKPGRPQFHFTIRQGRFPRRSWIWLEGEYTGPAELQPTGEFEHLSLGICYALSLFQSSTAPRCLVNCSDCLYAYVKNLGRQCIQYAATFYIRMRTEMLEARIYIGIIVFTDWCRRPHTTFSCSSPSSPLSSPPQM